MSKNDTNHYENNPPQPPFRKGGLGGFSGEKVRNILLIVIVAYVFLLGGAPGLLSKVAVFSILVLIPFFFLSNEIKISKDTLIVLVFAFLSIASPLYAEGSKWGSVLYSVPLLSGVLFYLTLRNAEGWKEKLVYTIVLCGVINGVFGLFQAVYQAPTGLFYNKNNYSHFLTPLIPLSLYLFSRSSRLIYAFVTFFLIFSNLLSDSRGGIITMGVILLAIFLFFWKEKQNRFIKDLALILCSAIAAYLIFFYARNVLIQPSSDNVAAAQGVSRELTTDFVKHTLFRVYIYRDTFILFLQSPIFGHGINSFGGLIHTVSNPYSYGLSIHGHNIFYNILMELGIVGLFIFLFFIITVLKGNGFSSHVFFFKISLVSFLVHNIVEYNFPAPPFQVLFYFLAALILEEEKVDDVVVTLTGWMKRFLFLFVLFYYVAVFFFPVIGHLYFERAKKEVSEHHIEKAFKDFLTSNYFGYSVEEFHEATAFFLHQAYLSTGLKNEQLVELAEQKYLKALKLDNLKGNLYMDIAGFYYKSGKIDYAEKYLTDAVRLFPYNQAYKFELAEFYRKIGKNDGAINILIGVNEFLKKYSALDPLRPRVFLELAENYKIQGDLRLYNNWMGEAERLKSLNTQTP